MTCKSNKKSRNNDSHKENIGHEQVVYTDNPSLFLEMFCSVPSENLCRKNQPKRKGKFIRIFSIIMMISLAGVVIGAGICRTPEFGLEKLPMEGDIPPSAFPLFAEDKEKIIISIAQTVTAQGWAEKLEAGEFEKAGKILAKQLEYIRSHPEYRSVSALFNWVADMEKYFYKRPSDTPLKIFFDEYRIEELLEIWERHKNDFRSLLKKLGAQEFPGFVQDRIYLLLERLRNEQILYVTDIKIFKKNFRKILEDGEPENSLILVENFRRKYPGVKGMDELKKDTENYLKIREAADQCQWKEVSDLIQTTEFSTVFFNPCIENIKKNSRTIPSGNHMRPVRPLPVTREPVRISDLKIVKGEKISCAELAMEKAFQEKVR